METVICLKYPGILKELSEAVKLGGWPQNRKLGPFFQVVSDVTLTSKPSATSSLLRCSLSTVLSILACHIDACSVC